MKPIGGLFKRINTLGGQNFNAVLAQYDLTISQLDILVTLFRNCGKPLHQRDIEQRLMLKNPTVTGTLKRLEAKGYIARSQSDEDRRYNVISLTDKARRLDDDLTRSRLENDARMTRGFSESEKEALIGYLERVIENLGGNGGIDKA